MIPRFLSAFVLSMALTAVTVASAADMRGGGPKLGLQTWTCRDMDFDQMVAFAVQHHIKYIEAYSKHVDPLAPRAESLRKKAVLEKNGLVMYSFGVNQTSLDKEANRKLFEFAKLMGIKLIIVEPQQVAIWDNLEELVKEYDIKVAVHNHNLNSTYGNPMTVKAVLYHRDPRMGVCLDIGWATAAGWDAAKVFKEYDGRVFDLHFKDKKFVTVDGKTEAVDTLIGEGKTDYPALFDEMKKEGWSGVMAIETDSKEFAKDPGPLVDGARKVFETAFGAH